MAVPALVSVFLVLLGTSWLMASPPGSPFDEGAHYVKAIGAGGGDLLGDPFSPTPAQLRALVRGLEEGDREARGIARLSRSRAFRWQRRTIRQFDIPERLRTTAFGCTSFDREVTGACLDEPRPPPADAPVTTYTGTYQPYVYVPAGLAARAANEPQTAMRLGRAAMLAISIGLLVLAVWLLWSPAAGAASLLGLVGAITPMVVFVSSVLSPSGPEIAGAVCFAAALLRLRREEEGPGWVWAAAGLSGAVLASSRALGPAFVAVLLLSVSLLGGRWPRPTRAALWSAVALVVGIAAGVVWEFTNQPRPSPSGTSVTDAIGPSFENLPELVDQAIGVFGALDAPLPVVGRLAWLVLLAVLAGAALWAGTRRDRLSIAGLLGGALLVTLVMSVVYREIGPLQGRYALPYLVLLPLFLGEVLHRRRARLPAALVGGVFALAAAVQGLAWLANAHRFAVGQSGSWWFLFDSGWSPPLGWLPWALVAAAGAAALALAGLRPRASAGAARRTASG